MTIFRYSSYTYLYIEYTTNAEEAATGFEFLYSGSSIPGLEDLGHKTSKIYRYVKAIHDSDPDKIYDVAQWRTDGMKGLEDVIDVGYMGTTWDINRDRGDYIYVIWKTVIP